MFRASCIFSTVALTFLLAAPNQSHARDLDAELILKKMEDAAQKTRDLKADFRQERIYSLFDERNESSGKVYFKKPGKMLWRYSSPDNNSIYINGQQAIMYLPDIKQVQKISLLRDRKTESLLIGFCNTAEEIKRNFNVKVLPPKDGRQVLELTPRREELSSQFKRLRLVIDEKNWRPTRIERFELGGDKTIFTFSNVKTNCKLKDSLFDFKIPDGVEVVRY